jgi:uncharacterized protein (TIGR03382 family)
MRAIVFLVALGLCVVLHERPAEACSCGPAIPIVIPKNGSTNVPVNASVAVHGFATNVSIEIHDRTTPQSLTTTVQDHGTWLRVAASYEANHEYEVVVTHGAETFRSTFTTGADMDITPPAFTGLRSVAFETMPWPVLQPDGYCSGSCDHVLDGRVSRIKLGFDLPPADTALLVFSQSHEGVVEELVVWGPWTDHVQLTPGVCNQVPLVREGDAYCARVIAYDLAGNASGEDIEICDEALDCEPALKSAATCEPADVCTVVDASSGGGCNTSGDSGGLAALGALLAWLSSRRRCRAA